MLRNKGTGPVLLKWNGIEKSLEVKNIIDVEVFGVKAEKDKSILEDRFIAKYPDSIERTVGGLGKTPETKVDTDPGPSVKSSSKPKFKKKK
jgi:hypothetical protein